MPPRTTATSVLNEGVTAEELTRPDNAAASNALAEAAQNTRRGRTPDEFVAGMDGAIENGQQALQAFETQLQTPEVEQRDDVLQSLLGAEPVSSQQVFESTFDRQARQLGFERGEDMVSQLRDANTNLANLRGRFRTAEQAVSGAEGQSRVFEGVQLSELDRQRAVELGNAALVQQSLLGNYQTARNIARDTAAFAIEDRQVELQNLQNQFAALQEVVGVQEQRQLMREQRRVEREQAELERTQTAIDQAIDSGAATTDEMQRLASTDLEPDAKRVMAQQIVARAAQQQAEQERQQIALQQRNVESQIDTREAGVELDRSRLGLEQRRVDLAEDQQEFNEKIQRQKLNRERQEKALEESKADKKVQREFRKADRVLDKVDEAIEQVNVLTAGPAAVFSFFPGGAQKDLSADLRTIQANLGFDELQAMRDASPTGGALGQVSEREIDFLQATVENLDQFQSPDQLSQSLQTVKTHYQNWKATAEAEQTGEITVVSPDGSVGRIPADQLEQAFEEGYDLP